MIGNLQRALFLEGEVNDDMESYPKSEGGRIMQSKIIPIRSKDHVTFSCISCGNCCRGIKDQIMLEPLDAYRLARYLRHRTGSVETIEDVYSQYTHPLMLEEIYPVFLLNTRNEDRSCVFLRDSRCSVYDGRPRGCRLYPFTVENGHRGRRFIYYQCIDRHAAHFKGGQVSVEEWMYQNFTRDAREFIEAENTALRELGKLLLELSPEGRKHFMFQLLYYRYYNYDLDQPFQPQYEENQRLLIEALQKEL